MEQSRELPFTIQRRHESQVRGQLRACAAVIRARFVGQTEHELGLIITVRTKDGETDEASREIQVRLMGTDSRAGVLEDWLINPAVTGPFI